MDKADLVDKILKLEKIKENKEQYLMSYEEIAKRFSEYCKSSVNPEDFTFFRRLSFFIWAPKDKGGLESHIVDQIELNDIQTDGIRQEYKKLGGWSEMGCNLYELDSFPRD